jgi:hypothetical protein
VDLINNVITSVNIDILAVPFVITSTLLPSINAKTIELVKYVEDLFDEKLKCKEITEDLYGMGNSFCTVATQGLDARWVSLLVLAITFLVTIPIWICAANSFYDPEQREREERELAGRRQSKGRKSTHGKGKKAGRAQQGSGIQRTAEF